MSDLNTFLAETGGESEPAAAGTEPAEDLTPATAEAGPAGEPQEPRADDDEAPPQGDRRDQAIWREERERRRELQRQVDAMNQRWQQMVERMQQGQQQQPPQQPTAESKPDQEIEVPDFNEDPIGHLRAKNELLERQLQDVTAERSQRQQAVQQMQQFETLRTNVQQLETEFAKNTADYGDAVGFMYDQVRRMGVAMGYPESQLDGIVSQTAMDITVRALQQGKNPAQAAYEAARAMGWSGPQPAAEEGEPAPSAPRERPKPPTSLSGVAGKRTTAGVPSLDAISKMEPAEFDEFWAKMERSARGG